MKLVVSFIAAFIAAGYFYSGAGKDSTPVSQTREDTTGERYTWIQLTAAADFPKSYNFQLFSDGNLVRAIHSRGIWESADGGSWRKTDLPNVVINQAFLKYLKYHKYVYALGSFDGNIEHYTMTSRVARTSDFKGWETLTEHSNLPRRFFYRPFVFRDRMWIIGGTNGTESFNDAWTSTDGSRWTKIADNLPFGKRSGEHFVVFKDSLYMLDNDVWISGDGLSWRQITPRITNGNIFGYAVEVFGGSLWLIGCNRDGKFQSEVLSSADGITWDSRRAPWSPRGGVATCIFNDRLIMTGGKYGGPGIAGQTEFIYSNDVWALTKVK